MKGKKLLCIVLSLAAICSLLLTRDSVAWFNTSTGQPPTGVIHVENMAFAFNGSLHSYLQYTSGNDAGSKYVVTEQNLIVTNGGKLTVISYSTIATQARFKILYDTPGHLYSNNAANLYTASATDTLSVTVDSNWVQSDNDGYFYYLPLPEGGSQRGTGFAANDNTEVVAITDIHYLDTLVINGVEQLNSNDYFPQNGDPFEGSVHVIFEAKQAANVTWTQIDSWASA